MTVSSMDARLRVISLSLSPSSETRKKHPREKKILREILGARNPRKEAIYNLHVPHKSIVLFARADWLARRRLAKYYSPPLRTEVEVKRGGYSLSREAAR